MEEDKNEEEVFRQIPGFSMYEVSNKGRVISYNHAAIRVTRKPIELKHCMSTWGYKQFYLIRNDNKPTSITLHKIMAMAFLGHKPSRQKLVVDHIDNDKTNNSLSNLQIITSRENTIKDKKNNTGYRGVHEQKTGKFVTGFNIEGNRIRLYGFDTAKDANEAYNDVLQIYLDRKKRIESAFEDKKNKSDLITAEEFVRNKIKDWPEYKGQSMAYVDITAEQALRWAKEYADLCSVYHVEAQRQAILDQLDADDGAYTHTESVDRAYNIEENIK